LSIELCSSDLFDRDSDPQVDARWRLGDAAGTHLQVSATGAQWSVDVRGAGVRFVVHLDATTWAPRVETDGSAPAQTLEDALLAETLRSRPPEGVPPS
jgi:hypothetical protein